LSIFSVIRKDLVVYTRHRKTLLLIFLAPILIMVLIGSVFSGSTETGFRDVKLGVGGGSGSNIIQELNASNMFQIVEVNTTDPAVIEDGVKKGKYNAGIFIPENQTQPMRLYLDNSRVQIAPVISTVFLTTTEKISYELTLGFITKLWENLAIMESELEPLKNGVLKINSSVKDLNNDTQDVLASLDEMNITRLNNSLIVMKNTLLQMSLDLNRTTEEITATQKELRELDTNVSSIYSDAVVLRDELKIVVDNINSTDNALLGIETSLQASYTATCIDPTTPQCISLVGSIQQVKDTRLLLADRTGRITTLYASLDSVVRRSSQLHDTLNQTDIRLQNMQRSISSYVNEISNIHGNITDLETAVITLENVKTRTIDVSSQMDKLSNDMANSSQGLVSDIESTKNILSEVIKKSPSAVAAPIKLEREMVFKKSSYLDFLMPGIISIVLMFISFLLASITIVQERAKKTLIRTLLTPLSLEQFIIAKTSALILIALLQGIILVIVAFVFYGVVVPSSLWGMLFLIILVYSAAFIGIGMALATYSESENTAMLSSLVLGIPMLFLSGIFFPFETMPELMVMLGNALPITMGIRALDSVLIYNEGFDGVAGYLVPLLGYGIAGIGLAYFLLRKEVID